MRTIEIPLTQGQAATISECDVDLVAPYKWAVRGVRGGEFKYAVGWDRENDRYIYMHRLIMGVLDRGRTVFVDHIDYNGLNNTRENIRICSPGQNMWRKRTRKSYLGTRGVFPQGHGFVAKITHEKRIIYLGYFDSEREAGIAYTAAATALFGEFAPEDLCKVK